MKDQQKSLFEKRSEPGHSHDPEPAPRPFSIPKPKNLWFILTIAFIAYAFLGEFILPEALRLSTFIGTRTGYIRSTSDREAAPGAAYSVCMTKREEIAQTLYAECLKKPLATGPECDFTLEQARSAPCE